MIFLSAMVLLLGADAPAVVHTPVHADTPAAAAAGFEERYDAGDLAGEEPVYAGATYRGSGLVRGLRQGHVEYRLKKQDVFLVHDYRCTAPYQGAEMPWDCEASVFVLRKAPDGEGGGYVEVAHVEHANGEQLLVHPSLPVFAVTRAGCCDGPSRVAIYDMLGRAVCPAADSTAADPFAGSEAVSCPGTKKKPEIPAWSKVLTRSVPKKK